jgi:plasmid stabilization system protein ParE
MKVHFRAKALDDIHRIYNFRSREHSYEVAEHVEAAIFATTKMLGRHPEFGATTDHNDVRRWPMTEYDYAILYLIDWQGGALDVLRVVDGKSVRSLKRLP